MIDHPQRTVVRRAARALALAPAALLLGVAGPALASPPQQWQQPPTVTGFDMLLVLFLIPAGLFILITLLVMLPSMIKGHEGAASYQPGLAWRHEPEWFGGPREGLEKADKTDPATVEAAERGGASGQW